MSLPRPEPSDHSPRSPPRRTRMSSEFCFNFATKRQPGDFCAPGITVDDVMKIKEIFDLLDYDGAGVINVEEAINELESLGATNTLGQEPMVVAMKECLQNGPFVDLETFITTFTRLMEVKECSEESLKRTWRFMDDEGHGRLRLEDFDRIVRKYDLQFASGAIVEMFQLTDAKRRGEISFDDFKAVMMRARGGELQPP